MARTQTAISGSPSRLGAPQQYAGINAPTPPAQVTLESVIDELEKMMNRLHTSVDRAISHEAALFGANPLPTSGEATPAPHTVLARLQYISMSSHSLCSTLEQVLNNLETQSGQKLR